MAPLRPTERPTRRDLDQLTEQIRPDLEDLFQRHGLSQADAERLLRATLVRLAYQWDRIRNRVAARHAGESGPRPREPFPRGDRR